MNVVDSSGWLEYFADGPGARHFELPLAAPERLIVPTISIFEVFRRVLQQRDETAALQAVALMRQGRAVDLDESLALDGARLAVVSRLPMADSLILATARRFGATLWTQDADLEGLEGVRYFPKAAR
jgi:predicted nucleic acid-binding protein